MMCINIPSSLQRLLDDDLLDIVPLFENGAVPSSFTLGTYEDFYKVQFFFEKFRTDVWIFGKQLFEAVWLNALEKITFPNLYIAHISPRTSFQFAKMDMFRVSYAFENLILINFLIKFDWKSHEIYAGVALGNKLSAPLYHDFYIRDHEAIDFKAFHYLDCENCSKYKISLCDKDKISSSELEDFQFFTQTMVTQFNQYLKKLF